MEKIQITEINITLVEPRKSLQGFANFIIKANGFSLLVNGVGIHKTLEGKIGLSYPAKKIKNQLRFYVKPLDRETAEIILKKVEEKYNELDLFGFKEMPKDKINNENNENNNGESDSKWKSQEG